MAEEPAPLSAQERAQLVDDLNMARKDLSTNVELLMKVTDKLVAILLQVLKAAR